MEIIIIISGFLIITIVLIAFYNTIENIKKESKLSLENIKKESKLSQEDRVLLKAINYSIADISLELDLLSSRLDSLSVTLKNKNQYLVDLEKYENAVKIKKIIELYEKLPEEWKR